MPDLILFLSSVWTKIDSLHYAPLLDCFVTLIYWKLDFALWNYILLMIHLFWMLSNFLAKVLFLSMRSSFFNWEYASLPKYRLSSAFLTYRKWSACADGSAQKIHYKMLFICFWVEIFFHSIKILYGTSWVIILVICYNFDLTTSQPVVFILTSLFCSFTLLYQTFLLSSASFS